MAKIVPMPIPLCQQYFCYCMIILLIMDSSVGPILCLAYNVVDFMYIPELYH